MSSLKEYCYPYPRPAMTADAVVLIVGDKPKILLIKRAQEPFKGLWALPGGFLDENESAEDAVRRELQEETGLVLEDFKQIKTFSRFGRDPRGHIVTVAFLSVIDAEVPVNASDDASGANWFATDALPDLAADHDEIVAEALKKYRKSANGRS